MGTAVRVIEDGLVDRGRPGEHGDPLGLDQRHGPPRVVHQLRHQGGAADQAGQDAGLEAEAVEERVDHEVAVGAGEAPALGPGPGDGQRLPVGRHRPLAPPGRARGEQDVADVPGTHRAGALGGHAGRDRCRPLQQLAPAEGPLARCAGRAGLDGDLHDQAEPVEARAGRHPLSIVRGAQGGEAVGAEERAGHDQGAGAAAADHVERLMAGEPGADRDQCRARVERAERAEHPVMGVGGPDGHPVPGGHALGDQRPGDRGYPLVQLAVAEPRPARLGQGGRVAELPGRPGDRGRDGGQLHRGSL